jgi:hypothetical protein
MAWEIGGIERIEVRDQKSEVGEEGVSIPTSDL